MTQVNNIETATDIEVTVSSLFGNASEEMIVHGNTKRQDVDFHIYGAVTKPTSVADQRSFLYLDIAPDDKHVTGYKCNLYSVVRAIAQTPESETSNGLTCWVMTKVPDWKIGINETNEPISTGFSNRVNNNNAAQMYAYISSPSINTLHIMQGTITNIFVPVGPQVTQAELTKMNEQAMRAYRNWLYSEEATAGGVALRTDGKLQKFVPFKSKDDPESTMQCYTQEQWSNHVHGEFAKFDAEFKRLVSESKLGRSSAVFVAANKLLAGFTVPTGVKVSGIENMWTNVVAPATHSTARLHCSGIVNVNNSVTVDERHPDYTYGLTETRNGLQFARLCIEVNTLNGETVRADANMYDINGSENRSRAELFVENAKSGTLELDGTISLRHNLRSTGQPYCNAFVVTVNSYRVSQSGVTAPTAFGVADTEEGIALPTAEAAPEVIVEQPVNLSAFGNVAGIEPEVEVGPHKGSEGRGRRRRGAQQAEVVTEAEDPLAAATTTDGDPVADVTE